MIEVSEEILKLYTGLFPTGRAWGFKNITQSQWILSDCHWEDNNVWKDEEFWCDGEIMVLSGRLYNFYAYTHEDFAPEGWRIPTDDDFKTLEMYLGMSQSEADDIGGRGTNEGSKLAGNYDMWIPDGVDNLRNDPEFGTSGFDALPSGDRYDDGFFNDNVNIRMVFYGFDPLEGENRAGVRGIDTRLTSISRSNGYIEDGSNYAREALSVRLIKEDSENPGFLMDADGNVYETIKIGNQVWTRQNWVSTKLKTGVDIPNVEDNTEWANTNTLAYCNYNNDINNALK
jgi:uncharacterized protein (TIGR02145 family)